jgi:hypothetical protein
MCSATVAVRVCSCRMRLSDAGCDRRVPRCYLLRRKYTPRLYPTTAANEGVLYNMYTYLVVYPRILSRQPSVIRQLFALSCNGWTIPAWL